MTALFELLSILVKILPSFVDLSDFLAAFANPTYLNAESVNPEELENEKSIIKAQALKEGKPEQIIDKIVSGRINKYYKEVCLINQTYIKDDKVSIKDVLPKNCTINHFVRFSLS